MKNEISFSSDDLNEEIETMDLEKLEHIVELSQTVSDLYDLFISFHKKHYFAEKAPDLFATISNMKSTLLDFLKLLPGKEEALSGKRSGMSEAEKAGREKVDLIILSARATIKRMELLPINPLTGMPTESSMTISHIKRPLPTINKEREAAEVFFQAAKPGMWNVPLAIKKNKIHALKNDVMFELSCSIKIPLSLLHLKVYTDFIKAGRENVVKETGQCVVSENTLIKMLFGDTKITAKKRSLIRDAVRALRSTVLLDVPKGELISAGIYPTADELLGTICGVKLGQKLNDETQAVKIVSTPCESLLEVQEEEIIQANGKRSKGWSFYPQQTFLFYDLSASLQRLGTLNPKLMPPNFDSAERSLSSYVRILQDFCNPKHNIIKFSERYMPQGLGSQMVNKWKNRILSIFEHWQEIGVCEFRVKTEKINGKSVKTGIEITKRDMDRFYGKNVSL